MSSSNITRESSPLMYEPKTEHKILVETFSPNGHFTTQQVTPVPSRISIVDNSNSNNNNINNNKNANHNPSVSLHNNNANDNDTFPQSPSSNYGDYDHAEFESFSKKVRYAIWISLACNVVLFVAKVWSAVASHSLAVAASAVDSFLDLLSQLIIFISERSMRKSDWNTYPAGKARLEPIGVILCAAAMGMFSLQIILQSGETLIKGLKGEVPVTEFDTPTIALLVVTIVLKIALYFYCNQWSDDSENAMTLAVDHRNDVLSNSVAAATALIAVQWPSAWVSDPIGAILMSVYITLNWLEIGREQIDKLVGKSADTNFVEHIRDLAAKHHPELIPDIIRAYHFGSRYLVELEVILPAQMTVRDAHDISLALQQHVEALSDVERCFVHVDYQARLSDEHDWMTLAQQREKQKILEQERELEEKEPEQESKPTQRHLWKNPITPLENL